CGTWVVRRSRRRCCRRGSRMDNGTARHGAADFLVAFGIFNFAETCFLEKLRQLANKCGIEIEFRRRHIFPFPGFTSSARLLPRFIPLYQSLQCIGVSVDTQAANQTYRGFTDQRAAAEFLPPVNMCDMDLDHRQVAEQEGVQNGDGGMRVTSGIDNDTTMRFA